jgi:hypothetical protein
MLLIRHQFAARNFPENVGGRRLSMSQEASALDSVIHPTQVHSNPVSGSFSALKTSETQKSTETSKVGNVPVSLSPRNDRWCRTEPSGTYERLKLKILDATDQMSR